MKLCVIGRPSFWLGMVIGCFLSAAAFELPYVNWHQVVPPIDARPLVVRQDAKGDGRFLAMRSGRRRHRGVDLVAPLGSPVRAIRSGTVVEVGAHRGLGRFVDIEHPHHLHSVYGHLNEVTVDVGERVKQGALVGTVGKTGNARHPWITPHLHLEVLRNGESIDPQIIGFQIVSGGRELPAAASSRQASLTDGATGSSSDASGGE